MVIVMERKVEGVEVRSALKVEFQMADHKFIEIENVPPKKLTLRTTAAVVSWDVTVVPQEFYWYLMQVHSSLI